MSSAIKAILAPLIPGHESVALAWAARLAGDFDARVDGAFIRHEERLATVLFGPNFAADANPSVIEELRKAQREAEAAARLAFQSKKDEIPKAPFGGFYTLSDVTGVGIERAARCYDLAVTLLAGDPLSKPATELLLELVLGAGVPVFAVPSGAPADRPLDRAIVAWDASCEAGRALRASLPLLKRAKQVKVIHLGAPLIDYDPARTVIAYLKAHQIPAELIQSAAIDFGEGATLLDRVETAKADFLVMGAYGHPRWMEALGGATHDVIRFCPVPVLLAH